MDICHIIPRLALQASPKKRGKCIEANSELVLIKRFYYELGPPSRPPSGTVVKDMRNSTYKTGKGSENLLEKSQAMFNSSYYVSGRAE